MTSNSRQIGLACLLCGHVALTFFLTYHNNPLASGVVTGQVAALSIWAAVGPGRWTDRLPRTAFLLVMLWFVILWGYRARAWPLSLEPSLYYLIGMIAKFAVLLTLFGLARQLLGWRIEHKRALAEEESLRETQFHVGRLLAWVGGIAVLLAMSRYLLPRVGPVRLYLGWEVLVLLGVLNVFTALIAVMVFCVASWSTRNWFTCILFLAASCIILSAIELCLVQLINLGYPYGVLLLLNVGLAFVLAITLALLRGLGFTASHRAWSDPERPPGGSPEDTVDSCTSRRLPAPEPPRPPSFDFLEAAATSHTADTEKLDRQAE